MCGTYHDVAIGSSESKTIHAGPFLAVWPRLLARRNFQTPFVERNVLVGVLEIIVGEDKAAFQHQCSLDHTGDT